MSTVSCAAASWADRRGGAEHNSGARIAAHTSGDSRRFYAAFYGDGGRPELRDTNKPLRVGIKIATLNLAFPLASRARCRRDCCFHGDGMAPR